MSEDNNSLSDTNQTNINKTNATIENDKFNINIDLSAQTPDDSELVIAFDKAVKQAKEKIIQRRPELKEIVDDETENKEEINNEDKNNSNEKMNDNYKGKRIKNNKKSNNNTKKNVNNRNNNDGNNKNNNTWSKGKPCRAVFHDDGIEYEAVICNHNAITNEYLIKFIGYGNKQIVNKNQLKLSNGPNAVLEQKIAASKIKENTPSELNQSFYSPSSSERQSIPMNINFNNLSNSNKFLPSDINMQNMPPLPPPTFLSGQNIEQSDSLSAVLMAWYMAGYHTGKYEASLNHKQNYNKPYNKLFDDYD